MSRQEAAFELAGSSPRFGALRVPDARPQFGAPLQEPTPLVEQAADVGGQGQPRGPEEVGTAQALGGPQK
jgi:hypothetical protein